MNGAPEPPVRSIAVRIGLLAVASALVVGVVLSWLGHRAETAAAMRGVDAKLAALVAAADPLVTDDVHRAALAGFGSGRPSAPVDPALVRAVTERLTAVADEAGVAYLYTCVRPDQLVYVEATSLSPEERAKGEEPTLMRIYERPPPELLASLDDGRVRTAEYEDEYGRFRSIFRPVDGPWGRIVVAADVHLDELRATAFANAVRHAVVAAAILVPVALAALWLGRRIAAPLRAMAENVRTFADDDFGDDDASCRTLERIVARETDETRTLAASILDLRRRLVRYLEEFRAITAEKSKIASKLAIARDIQRGLLPQTPPTADGFDIAGWSEAADETGGDFYDWIETPHGDIVFVLADVTGHGVGPSLMAAVCRAYARATLVEASPIEPLLERLNKLVHGDARSGQFVTFFAGVLSPASRVLTVLSAAHGPILVYRAKERAVEETPTHGLPLGVIEELATDPGTRLVLEPGDVLMVVSDGFFEWANTEGEQFGHERLAAALLASADRPAAEIIEFVRSEVYRFTVGTTQPDDMTALVVRALDR
jgi:serine phosphatase RsbU (regulator of sigma subunit)